MYQNIYYDRFNEEMHLWDDEEGHLHFKYEPYAYVVDRNGTHVTMDGQRVRKTHSWSNDGVQAGTIYEAYVKPEMRILIDQYHNSDEVSKGHCVFYFDIEVAKEGKYSSPEDADNTITSIAYYDTINREYTCLILDRDGKISMQDFGDVTVRLFRTERDMLKQFIHVWRTTPITIVTGWNVLWYDIQYLYNRIEKVFGKFYGNMLSPIRKVDYFTNRYGDTILKIAGISILDYMQLYKEFTYTEQSSYSLEAIAQYELNRGKIQYEKDLDHLLETDPLKFIEYNVEDVRLVVDMDRKLDFIAIAQGTCHKGHVPYEDIFYTSRYMEGACLTETKRRNLVATRSEKGSGGKAKGAFVKKSKAGRYEWVYDLDLTSLYPSNIMSLNISPETKIAKVIDWDTHEFIGGERDKYEVIHFAPDGTERSAVRSRDDIHGLLDTEAFGIAANGVIYQQVQEGLIPSILDKWFNERKEYRRLATEYHKKGDIETHNYYDRKQKIQKVLLNSLYGVLLLPSFRFYDKDNGEGVTLTGQQLIHFTTEKANEFYNNELGTEGVDYCLYTDTDSVFYESMPIIKHRYGDVDEDQIPELTIKVATEVQDYINKAYDEYAEKYHFIQKHRWNIKQELVSRRAFWGSAKKRYAMWNVREGSKVIDEADIKGFDSVRSSFPKLFRKFLEDVIIDILHDATPEELNTKIIEFKEEMSEYSLYDIMNPTSVSDITKWIPTKVNDKGKEVRDQDTRYKKGTPIHVKSAMNYNMLMDDLGIKTAPKIQDGDKILWAYLNDNPYNFDTMALVGFDDPEDIIKFVNKYINRDKTFDRALSSKLQAIWDDLGWGSIIMNPNVYKFFKFTEYE